jgi:hypothetical protein
LGIQVDNRRPSWTVTKYPMTTKSILTTLSEEKVTAQYPTMSRESLRWLLQKVAALRNPTRLSVSITKEQNRWTKPGDRQKFLIGGMYYFVYDPKGKANLPYYDRFPLVLPLKRQSDGFIGLNLHYLPLKYRVLFLRKLLNFAIYNENDEIKRIRITYQILEASAKLKEFRPCIKHYLYNHIKSRILAVESNEWDIATYLPIQQFKKAKPQEVWKDSLQEIRKS